MILLFVLQFALPWTILVIPCRLTLTGSFWYATIKLFILNECRRDPIAGCCLTDKQKNIGYCNGRFISRYS